MKYIYIYIYIIIKPLHTDNDSSQHRIPITALKMKRDKKEGSKITSSREE